MKRKMWSDRVEMRILKEKSDRIGIAFPYNSVISSGLARIRSPLDSPPEGDMRGEV